MQDSRTRLGALALSAAAMLAACSEPTATSPFAAPTAPLAVRTATYAVTDLPGLGGFPSAAVAIDARGWIVGYGYTTDTVTRAVLWRDGAVTNLGTLATVPGPTVNSDADAIDPSGRIVGTSKTDAGYSHAFLWEAGAMTDLGVLPGGLVSVGQGIAANGSVVGAATVSNNVLRAFLWREGVMTDLGTLGGTTSEARGVNEQGQVVGASATSSGETHAFLWQRGTMIDLDPASVQSHAYDITASGQSIVGDRAGASPMHAALWTVE
jgi:probable HAF family extracellular repeat protein